MPLPVPVLSETTAGLCLFFVLLVPLAAAAIALINAGLGRSRSAAHALLASLLAVAIAGLVYVACGFALQGYIGRPSHSLFAAGRPWGWMASEPLFLRGIELNGSAASLAALLQIFSVGLAALIPLGSGADRWRLGACCVSTALFAGLVYPLFGHWVWGGGWLAGLGANCGLGRGFLDAGGSGAIHATGGLTALALAWILGPRRGKYGFDGAPAAIPGHNAVMVLFACLLALPGWAGLNCAGAILFTGAEPGRAILIVANTFLAAMAAALGAAAVTRLRFGKPDASLCANGWIAGLVASSAGCAFFPPAIAVLTGLAAGVLAVFAVEWLEAQLGVDDPGGAISVHAAAGLWGVLAAGLFLREPGQWLAQLAGIATLIGFVLPLAYGLNWCVDRTYRQRVASGGERYGMDLYELGAGAYPEFLTNTGELGIEQGEDL